MVDKFRTIILSYALMQNHYHLLIETPHANLSQTMHYLNSCYVNWFRAKYKLVGSVLQGRFYASLIEKEAYLDVASAYIHLNPLRAGIVHFPDQYQWSSYASLMRKTPFPPWLSNDIILGEFSGDVNDYERFVMECFFKEKDILYESYLEKHCIILGSDNFKKNVTALIKSKLSDESMQEIPDSRKLFRLSPNEIKAIILEELGTSEEQIFSRTKNNLNRKIAIYAFHKYTDAKLKDIATLFSIRYTAVSEAFRVITRDALNKTDLAEQLLRIDRAVTRRRQLS